jgi:hypothetical protein
MAAIKDVIAYFIANYPESMKHELSNARLTKMVYLADWHSSINGRGQITNINWYFDNFGPFVRDIEQTAIAHPEIFQIETLRNAYGSFKKQFSLKNLYAPRLTGNEIESLDHIIEVTKKLYWNDFIRLVYGTHPIASSERYEYLDLSKKAAEYLELKGMRRQA